MDVRNGTRIIDEVENYLRDRNIPFHSTDDGNSVRMCFGGGAQRTFVEILADESRRRLKIVAHGGIVVPPARRLIVALFVAYANSEQDLGAFVINLHDGNVFFQTSVLVPDKVSEEMIERHLVGAAGTYAKRHYGLMSLLSSESDFEANVICSTPALEPRFAPPAEKRRAVYDLDCCFTR